MYQEGNTPEAIKKLWLGNKNTAAREEYLFDAIISLKETLCKEFRDHRHVCRQRYITRKQAMIVGALILALTTGIAVGTGYLTIPELIKSAIGKI